MKNEQLEIVDENDVVIGLESRKTIHEKGLLHREVHIWFFTPNGEIVFQHRAKNKETYPDKLDATVGGHVEIGVSYMETALKECEEETGLKVDPQDLRIVRKVFKNNLDADTGLKNCAISVQYAYLFKGNVNDLRVEAGKAVGFELWSVDKLYNLSESDKNRFIPSILTEFYLKIFEEAQKILGLK